MTARTIAAAAALALAALSTPEGGRAEAQQAARPDLPRTSFTLCCPRPDWWDEVEAPRIDDTDGFYRVWQDRTLDDRAKAKALFDVAERFRDRDTDLAAPAFAYFGSVARHYPQRRGFYEFALDRYLDYDRPLAGYSGMSGDLSAGMARKLAEIYLDDGDPALAVPVLHYMLDVRAAEVNDHLKELMSLTLARALDVMGRPAEAVAVLVAARRDFDGDWEPGIDKALDGLRRSMGPVYYLHDRSLSGPLAMVVLLGASLALVAWKRRPRG